MQYFNTARLTARAAWSTLCVLDRQARRDTRKVSRAAVRIAQFFTSRQAIATYRSLGQLFLISCHVAIALGMSARDAYEWAIAKLDAYVAACEVQPTSELADPWDEELTEAEALAPILPLMLPAAPAPIALLPAAKEVAKPARRAAKPKAKAPAKPKRTRTKKAA